MLIGDFRQIAPAAGQRQRSPCRNESVKLGQHWEIKACDKRSSRYHAAGEALDVPNLYPVGALHGHLADLATHFIWIS
eukprot:s699_g39.t1